MVSQRKSEHKKALHYYQKAAGCYIGQEISKDRKETLGLLCYEMSTVYLSCQDYSKSREFLEQSYAYSPKENPHRTYVHAILCAAEGNRAESERLVATLPEYLEQRIIDRISR